MLLVCSNKMQLSHHGKGKRKSKEGIQTQLVQRRRSERRPLYLLESLLVVVNQSNPNPNPNSISSESNGIHSHRVPANRPPSPSLARRPH